MIIAMRCGPAALALALSFAALTPAGAQQPPPAAAPQAPAAATADPARLTAARQLLAATNTDAQFTTIIPLMFRQMRQTMPAQGPQQQTEVNQVFDEIQKQFIDRRGEILDQIAQLYAERFTADEMNTLAEFYRSPIGQKFIAAMPDLAADAMRLGTNWGQRIGQEAQQKIRDELQKRGLKL
jgi:uncharacterized protein